MGYALTLNVPVNLLYGPSRAHILPFVAHMPCVAAREAGFVCLFSGISWIVLQCFAALVSLLV